MKTHCTLAAASFALAAATAVGALAAPPHAEIEKTTPLASFLTTEAVVGDLVKFRQADPGTQQLRDGEWYNVPAPLGLPRARTVGDEMPAPAARAVPVMQRTGEDTRPGQ